MSKQGGMMELSDSLEDYLETILILEKTHKVARVKDIAERLGILRGSVTSALKKLEERKLIHYEPYSFITLTAEGKAIAGEIARRHAIIKNFLCNVLQIDAEAAETNACRMEHAMDQTAIEQLVQFIEYIHHCPRTGPDWVNSFVNYVSEGKPGREICEKCLNDCISRYLENNG